MRIRLKPKTQQELIENAKAKNGLTWKDLSEKLNHSENYVRNELRYGKRLVSEECYKRLCMLIDSDYENKIIERLPSNWGQVRGGQKSKTKPHKVEILVNNPSAELAEIIGIMLGDGNLWTKKGYYYARITGHSKNDRKYLLEHVKKLFKKVFGIDMNVLFLPRNAVCIQKGSKNLIYTFKKYGLPTGNRKAKNVGIPQWIFKSDKYIKSCIRGLIDTDGCVCPITNRNYSYIWFKCANSKLREDFQKAMNMLGFKIGKWTDLKGTPYTFIAKKSLIKKYFKEIGFKNPKHINRFKAPVV